MTVFVVILLITAGNSNSNVLNHSDPRVSCDVLDSNKDELCGYLVDHKHELRASLDPIYTALIDNDIQAQDLITFSEEDLRVIINEFDDKLPRLHVARLINILRNDENTYIYKQSKPEIYPRNYKPSPITPNKHLNGIESLIKEKTMDIKRLTLQHLKTKREIRQKYEKMMQEELAEIATKIDRYKQEIQRQIEILKDYQRQMNSGMTFQNNFKYLNFIRNWNISMNHNVTWPKTPTIWPNFTVRTTSTSAHFLVYFGELLKSSKCMIYISSNKSTITMDGMISPSWDEYSHTINHQDIFPLEPSTEYKIWMVVINKYGHSLPSNEITFTTKGKENYDEKAVGVVKLNGGSFDNYISQNNMVMVYFYAPWISHSRPLRSIYETVAKVIHSGECVDCMDVKFTEIDATLETELAEKYGVDEYPTLILFRNEDWINPIKFPWLNQFDMVHYFKYKFDIAR